MNKKYSKEKIKKMFQNYRDKGEIIITDKEYDFFCTAISFLNEKIIDKIYKEVHIIASSIEAAKKIHPACYINLDARDLSNKKGIILFTQLFFDWPTNDEDRYRAIYHEFAHHILEHIDFETKEEVEKADEEADKLAIKWMENAGIYWPPDEGEV